MTSYSTANAIKIRVRETAEEDPLLREMAKKLVFEYLNSGNVSNLIADYKDTYIDQIDTEEYAEDLELIECTFNCFACAEYIRNWIVEEYREYRVNSHNQDDDDLIELTEELKQAFKLEMMRVGWLNQCYGQDALSNLPISIQDEFFPICVYFRE